RGTRDVVQLPRVLPRDPPTQVVLLLRDGRFPTPVVKRKRIGVHEVLGVHGLITREELRAIYRTSHVAVFPYRFVRTGLPLVVLEAVAAGLPVVTTRVHPIRELEGRTGLVFARPPNPPDIGPRWPSRPSSPWGTARSASSRGDASRCPSRRSSPSLSD